MRFKTLLVHFGRDLGELGGLTKRVYLVGYNGGASWILVRTWTLCNSSKNGPIGILKGV